MKAQVFFLGRTFFFGNNQKFVVVELSAALSGCSADNLWLKREFCKQAFYQELARMPTGFSRG